MPTGLTLLFDGDDTLWENNVHFERAIAEFEHLLARDGWPAERIRTELDRIEEDSFVRGAVGASSFLANLRKVATIIAGGDELPEVDAALVRIVGRMPTTSVQPLPGVADTLVVLASRHVLGLVTRGDPAEQWAKIDSSGLRGLFSHIAVVADKTVAVYRGLVEAWALDPATTWMIGNSPRSDVVPARLAGLRAVHLPNASTWRLEAAELDDGDPGTIVIQGFSDLRDLF